MVVFPISAEMFWGNKIEAEIKTEKIRLYDFITVLSC
jgi:hypothetical protein